MRAEPVKGSVAIEVLTPVSDIRALAHLLRQGELLRLREPQKWILWPIWVGEGISRCPLSITANPHIYMWGGDNQRTYMVQ